MRKLISADFVRLMHDRFFRFSLIFMALVGVCGRFFMLWNAGPEYAPCLNDGFLIYVPFLGILQAVLCSLLIGQDYSDGTIRNKIMAGHSRSVIYLSGLFVCMAAGFLICAACLLTSCMVGIPLMGFFKNAPAMALAILYSLAISAVFSAVFTLLSMLTANRAAAVAASTLGIFAALFLSFFLHGRLQEPEFHPFYMYMDEEGMIITEEETPNPYYVSGNRRKALEFVTEFLPTGQTALLMEQDTLPSPRLFVWDALLLTAVTGTGMAFFGRKDLR